MQEKQTSVELPSFDVLTTALENGEFWIRVDFEEIDVKEQWATLCLLQEELREFCGMELVDPTVEYDCISGRLVKL